MDKIIQLFIYQRIYFFLVVILSISFSCSNLEGGKRSKKSLRGYWEQNRFENDYFSLKVPKGWYENLTNEEDQFLVLAKEDEVFSPSVIFISKSKKEFEERYKVTGVEAFNTELIKTIQAEQAVLKITESKISAFGGAEFIRNEFFIKRSGNLEVIQESYLTSIDNYYLIILTTDLKNDPDPAVVEIIESVIFKNIH